MTVIVKLKYTRMSLWKIQKTKEEVEETERQIAGLRLKKTVTAKIFNQKRRGKLARNRLKNSRRRQTKSFSMNKDPARWAVAKRKLAVKKRETRMIDEIMREKAAKMRPWTQGLVTRQA